MESTLSICRIYPITVLDKIVSEFRRTSRYEYKILCSTIEWALVLQLRPVLNIAQTWSQCLWWKTSNFLSFLLLSPLLSFQDLFNDYQCETTIALISFFCSYFFLFSMLAFYGNVINKIQVRHLFKIIFYKPWFYEFSDVKQTVWAS